ncbi:MAG: transporter substrate-binding domain-containing protein [Oscillospiraceae bacterium]|jgi:ABC-type amino acid transport substrate-binding protein|nr:transporter substrate-binding domain-containing protein [Oscillospiraceae bacterium]
MKKIVALVLAISLTALALTSCAQKSKKVSSPDDFVGARIAVQSATTASDSVDEMVAAGKKISIMRYEKVTECFSDLKLGRVDAVYVDSVVAAYYTKDDDTYNRVWLSNEAEPMGICLRKDATSLAAAVEAAIDTLYYNGKIAELATKHFGDDFTKGLREVKEAPVIPEFEGLKKAGTLTIGSEIGYPPMEYTTDDGLTNQGFDIDVANEIGKLLGGLKVEFVNTSFDGIFAGLEKGQYDCIISAISITESRQAKYILTKPYVANALCIVTKK